MVVVLWAIPGVGFQVFVGKYARPEWERGRFFSKRSLNFTARQEAVNTFAR